MPTAPLAPCSFPGCHRVSKRPFCLEHERHLARERAPQQRFYGTAAWRRLRRRILREQPFCVDCRGAATEVDHIKPRRTHPELALDPSNLAPRCKPCHSRRTAREGGRWG